MRGTAKTGTRTTWRRVRERLVRDGFATCVILSIVVLLGIFSTLAWSSVSAFTADNPIGEISPAERELLDPADVAELESLATEPPHIIGGFLADATWKPDSLASPRYGILGLIVSTLMTTVAALLLAVPLGIGTAAWLALRAPRPLRSSIKFVIEMLAAVPSVVVGFVGIELVGPWIGSLFGVPGGLTGLNGSVLLAIMALPTIISLSEDALSSVPRDLIEGSLALGADRWQTLVRVVGPAARSGIFAAIMLGMGRAIGETMTVLMVTGNAVAMPTGLLDPVRTMTATIAIELGEVPRGTAHYHMLFAIGLVLFLITLAINLAADHVQRRGARRFG